MSEIGPEVLLSEETVTKEKIHLKNEDCIGRKIKGKTLTRSRFIEIAFRGSELEECIFSHSYFERCYFRKATLSDVNLNGCVFRDCNFDGAQFINCQLDYVMELELRKITFVSV